MLANTEPVLFYLRLANLSENFDSNFCSMIKTSPVSMLYCFISINNLHILWSWRVVFDKGNEFIKTAVWNTYCQVHWTSSFIAEAKWIYVLAKNSARHLIENEWNDAGKSWKQGDIISDKLNFWKYMNIGFLII